MLKKGSLLIGRVAVFILILWGSTEILLRLLHPDGTAETAITVDSRHSSVADPVTGWKLKPGNYVFSVNNTRFFEVSINRKCNRVSGREESPGEHLPAVHMYGCSYVFGFSVPDTATSSYKLQSLLPAVQVENKGVPGYGLTQMYLALRQSLALKDTPVIAIFNYAAFHDMRTPLNKNNSASLVMELEQSRTPALEHMNFPYMDYKEDSLQLRYCPFNELPGYWPLHQYSLAVSTLNKMVFDYYDNRSAPCLHQIAKETALAIMQYCRLNHIVPVFASLSGGKDILEMLHDLGCYTIDYGIEVANDRDSTTIYNCGPSDPWHPSGYTHTLYAERVAELIMKENLVKMSSKENNR